MVEIVSVVRGKVFPDACDDEQGQCGDNHGAPPSKKNAERPLPCLLLGLLVESFL